MLLIPGLSNSWPGRSTSGQIGHRFACGAQRSHDHGVRSRQIVAEALRALQHLLGDRRAASEQIGIGKFGPALRGLMGKGAPAPDLASTLMALGRDEALARWDYGLKAG